MGSIKLTSKTEDRAISDTTQVRDLFVRRIFDDIKGSIDWIRTQLHKKTPLVEIVDGENTKVEKVIIKTKDEEKHRYSVDWVEPFVEEEVDDIEGIPFYNNSGMTIPKYGALEITDFQSDGTAVVIQPSEDNIDASLVIFNGEEEVASQQGGIAFSPFDGIYPVAFTGSATIGDDIGTVTDSFSLAIDNTGMTYIGSNDGTYANVRPKAGAAAGYDGMFKVEKLTDTSVRVNGYNASAERYWYNYVIVGLERITVAETTLTSITSSRWVYAGISYVAGWSCSLTTAVSLPAQTEGGMYHPIAWIDCVGGKISKITQHQHGCIMYNRRLV